MEATAFHLSLKDKRAFSIIEVLIALSLVSIGILLVGVLSQKISSMNKNARLSGTILELRSQVNSYVKNPGAWLSKMRGMNGIYSACIPSEDSVSNTFNCPTADPSLNSLLGDAANGYHVVVAPIYNQFGAKIAGTNTNPLYMNVEGQKCTNTNDENCILKSTGYFLRTNSSNNGNPGNVKFLISVEKFKITANSGAMKNEIIGIDLGSDWKSSISANCPSPNYIELGTMSDGTAYCVPVSNSCPASTIPVGVDNLGAIKCQAMPTCPSTQFAYLDPSGNLSCTESSTPCPNGTAHLGFYSGTTNPICSNALAGCSGNTIQVGINTSGETVSPICKSLPTCSADTQLSYNGTNFECLATTNNPSLECSNSNEILAGVNQDGTPICRTISSTNGVDGSNGSNASNVVNEVTIRASECEREEAMVGISPSGGIKCRKTLPSCAPNETIVRNSANTGYRCKANANISCNWAGWTVNKLQIRDGQLRNGTTCYRMRCQDGQLQDVLIGTKASGFDCGD